MKAGLIILDKPSGLSSAAVLSVLKKKLPRGLKIGHAGTLDPMATGVLVVVLGRATKFASYAQGGEKCYSGLIQLGQTTDTDDADGETLEHSVVPEFIDVAAVRQRFQGEILQLPPKVSAKKVAGKRAYALSRKGKDFTLSAVSVFAVLEELEQVSASTLRFVVRSGSGFYVRAMARDIGEFLGCGAHLTVLRRERSDPFAIWDCCALERPKLTPIERMFSRAEHQQVPDTLFDRLARGELSSTQFGSIAKGSSEYLILRDSTARNAVLRRRVRLGAQPSSCTQSFGKRGVEAENQGEYEVLSWYEDMAHESQGQLNSSVWF